MTEHVWLAAYWLFVNCTLAGLGSLVHRSRWLQDTDRYVRCQTWPGCDDGVARILRRGMFNNHRRAILKLLLLFYALDRAYIVGFVMVSNVEAAHWVGAILYTCALLWAYKWSVDAKQFD